MPRKLDIDLLLKNEYSRLLRFAYGKTGEIDMARSVCLESFDALRGSGADNPRFWLYMRASQLIRARQITRAREGTRGVPLTGAKDLDALLTIGPRDREVLLLLDSGFRPVEISKLTGLSEGDVPLAIGAARRRLVSRHRELSS